MLNGGHIAPFQPSGTEHVRIEEEQLEIVLRRTYAAVTVRYTMRNVTAAPAKVRFGFPVEATQLLEFEGDDRAEAIATRSLAAPSARGGPARTA